MAPSTTPTARRSGSSRLLVAVRWGGLVVAARSVGRGTVSVGEGASCDLFLSHRAVGERLEVARVAGAEADVAVPPGVPVRLLTAAGGLDRPGLEAAGRLSGDRLGLRPGEALRLELDPVELEVAHEEAPGSVVREPLGDEDFAFARLATAGLLVLLAGGAAAVLTPRPAWEEEALPARYVRLVLAPARPQELTRLARLGAVRPLERLPRPEERPAPRTQAGRPQATLPKAEADRQKVTHLLAGLPGAPLGGGLGGQLEAALGGLKATAEPEVRGGLSARGGLAGSGSGGLGLGLGGAAGVGGQAPSDVDLAGERRRGASRVIPGKTTVVGGLDREVIARVIQRHQSEIKFCFESELQRDPRLAGKVSVAWTIDPTGAVSEASVSESTLGSPAAERCILDRVRRWRFPEPRGGGVVAVTFPWLFKAAGEDPPTTGTQEAR